MRVKAGRRRGSVVLEVKAGESRLLSDAKETPFRLKQILVPIDFSEHSRKALRYALAFARQFGASISCVHVIAIAYGAGEVGYIAETEAYRKQIHEESQRRLDKLLRDEVADAVPSATLLRSGVPYHEIVEAAEEENADLIILGTHGRSGLSRVFLGSTAERVVRHAQCPVLVVREREREFVATPGGSKEKQKRASRGDK